MSRRASVGICECGQRVLCGTDSDVMGIDVVLDAGIRLTAAGELRAIERGRKTYRIGADREIWYRHEVSAGNGDPDIFVEHVCDRPVPKRYKLARPEVKQVILSEEPPF